MESGTRQIGKVEQHLLETYQNISDGRLKIWLLRTLMSRNLSTRDIFSFLKKQTELRLYVKTVDRSTMVSAMRMKLRDMKFALSFNINKKRGLEDKIREILGKTERIFRS